MNEQSQPAARQQQTQVPQTVQNMMLDRKEKRVYVKKNMSKYEFWPDGSRFDYDERYLLRPVGFPFYFAHDDREDEPMDLYFDYVPSAFNDNRICGSYLCVDGYNDFGAYDIRKVLPPDEKQLLRMQTLYGDTLCTAYVDSIHEFSHDLPDPVRSKIEDRLNELTDGNYATAQRVAELKQDPAVLAFCADDDTLAQTVRNLTLRHSQDPDQGDWLVQLAAINSEKPSLEWLSQPELVPAALDAATKDLERRIISSLPPHLPTSVVTVGDADRLLEANSKLLEGLLKPNNHDPNAKQTQIRLLRNHLIRLIRRLPTSEFNSHVR